MYTTYYIHPIYNNKLFNSNTSIPFLYYIDRSSIHSSSDIIALVYRAVNGFIIVPVRFFVFSTMRSQRKYAEIARLPRFSSKG